jgi:NADPH-dependent F420 reductase
LRAFIRGTGVGAKFRVSRTIAVIGGTGPEGFGLSLRWARAGETLIIGSRSAERAQEAAAKITQMVGEHAKVSGDENVAACAHAEIVVLTIPFEGHAALLKQIKPALRPGTIVVDTTVPLAASVGGRATRTLGIWQGSAAEQCAELVPPGVAVVSAFQNVSSELLNSEASIDCDVIVCSDDAKASKEIQNLAAKIVGVRAIDGGKLETSRILEQITAMLIGMNIRHKGHSGIRITGLPDAAYHL